MSNNSVSTNKNQKSKRIAANTIILFARMLVLMVINLYSVKFILKGLGIIDYGIFTTVAGVITTSGFIGGVLTLATQRFYSTALGKKDTEELKNIYTSSINIAVSICIIILVIFETIGIWFINNKLNIPETRIVAANITYQYSLLTFLCSFLQIPFASLIFAYERINIYAIISTFECIGKLLIAIGAIYIHSDHLTFYGAGLMYVAILILSAYVISTRKMFKNIKYRKSTNKKLYKSILSFSGWTIFGSFANTCMIQGGIILINLFFGPLLNAAFGIALQINNAVMALVNSMIVPFRPAMQKSYAEEDYNYVNILFNFANKFMYYILLVVALPLYINMKWILNIWLGNTTYDTIVFCRYILVYIIIMAMHNPITIIVHASGNIRNYHLSTESLTLMSLPLTWLFFKFNQPCYYIFIAMIITVLLAHFARIYNLKMLFPYFSLREYIYGFVIRATIISIISFVIAEKLQNITNNTYINLVISFIESPIAITVLVYCIGIHSKERELLKKTIGSFYYRLCNKH